MARDPDCFLSLHIESRLVAKRADALASDSSTFGRWRPARCRFLLLKNLIEVRMLTTFYCAKNDHQWVNYISLKTITCALQVHVAQVRIRLIRTDPY